MSNRQDRPSRLYCQYMTVLDPGIEQRACITGVGMSPIGRRTGIAGIDLTAAAARAAIADAGLRPADIDGIASMGDTPVGEAAGALGIDAAWRGGGFDTGGVLSPLLSGVLPRGNGQTPH